MQYLQAKNGQATLLARQQHRLETANLVIKAVACAGLPVFGGRQRFARLEFMAQGGIGFVTARENAQSIPIEASVTGRERVWIGFYASHAEQRLVRCLGAYVSEGRPVDAAMLVQALAASGNRSHKQLTPVYQQILEQFRFTRAFTKLSTEALELAS